MLYTFFMEVSLEKKLELINKIKFFARMDEEDKTTMANLSDFRQYQPGEALIQEGSATSDLLFIINGTVDIFVHGKHVVELVGGGHVFGEISFVYTKPASATVAAQTKVTAMVFNTDKLEAMTEPIYYKLKMEIYRSCAETLAKRLVDTNMMATSVQKS